MIWAHRRNILEKLEKTLYYKLSTLSMKPLPSWPQWPDADVGSERLIA
jgi:hypothetical protein